MDEKEKKSALADFRSRGDILLMSLKAGGVGITLTEATHLIIVEPWWNPRAEEQAIFRI